MRITKLLIFIILVSSCEKSDYSLDFLKGPWNKYDSDNIELFTRPPQFTNKKSPDSTDVDLILKNQNNFIDTINKRLNINCDSKFKIYLFNQDEAKELIVTNTGGYASPNGGSIYYTFFEKPLFYPDLNLYSYLGLHELVHLVTYEVFGFPKNRMITEGYACAIENFYGGHYGDNGELIRTMNREWMEYYVKNDMILTPNELLLSEDIPEKQYYQQVGTFINWLFDEFGVDQINKLYMTDKQDFKKRFKEILSIEFDDLEQDYIEFCNKEFK